MNKKFTLIYTIFASAIFVFAISFLTINLYKNYQSGVDTFPSKTTALELRLKKSSHSTLQYFSNNLEKNIKDYDNISAIQIKVNNKILYSYPSSDFVPASSRFVNYYYTTIDSNFGKISIEANYYLLSPSAVTYFCRIAFLIILIITLTTVILIINLTISENKTKSNYKETFDDDLNDSETTSEDNLADFNDSDDIYIEEEEEIFEDSEVIPEETPFELIDNETSVSEAEVIEETDTETETHEIESDSEDELEEFIDFKNDAFIDSDIFTEEDIPQDILDKNTELQEQENTMNLPYEDLKPLEITSNDINSRLDSEIERSIASEFDLSLFLVNVPGLTPESELYSNIYGYLTIQFQFKDLIFEYKDDCFAAIKVNMNLEEALNFSDKLIAKIKSICGDKECFMGISSRSVRMVTGERLLLEAEEALKHAKDEIDSPVVAFRVDADKYREYMEKVNS